MVGIRQRGSVWWIEGRIGPHRKRTQLSLGTRAHASAVELSHKIEHAIADGNSPLWPELVRRLPTKTFRRLREIGGWTNEPEPSAATWAELERKFAAEMERRILFGKFRASTRARYQQTIRAFGQFLASRGMIQLESVNRALAEDFKGWRIEQTRLRKQSRGGRGVVLDAAILHRVFAYAIECEMISRNPVRLEGRPGDNPEGGAQPFKAEDLGRLREHAGEDLLAFLLLRHTGLRGSDAVSLLWDEIDWDAREMNRLTLKRTKRVVLPIHTELFFALEAERDRRKPKPLDRVLLNPATGKAMTRPRLYERFIALGRRAGVPHSHPHRFRDTLAVDLLLKGMSPYDVAKLLGDTVETVEKHYAPFVRELRERARRIMETGEGLEKTSVTNWGQSPASERKIQ